MNDDGRKFDVAARPTAAFIGNMNAMPMTYALHLRECGWDVTYFVDTAPTDKLSRPEFRFPNIGYPYPDWIIERPIASLLVAALSPAFALRDIVEKLRAADVVFLSGLYLTMQRFLRSTQVVFYISHGSDLDAWCNRDSIEGLSKLFSGRIGRLPARLMVGFVVRRMIRSLRHVSVALTIPAGLSEPGDRVLARELQGSEVLRIPRFDISLADLPAPHEIRIAPVESTLRIICGTRHTFRLHPGVTDTENKGTDVIIRALARYARSGRHPVEIHFFEKGHDLQEAKRLCEVEGLSPHVVWHAEMPAQEYIELHQHCHIAFDQVGSHWLGAVGMYAMYLSLPLIANSCGEVLDRYWGESSPICHARSEEAILEWLIRLEDPVTRRSIGERSHRFAFKHFGGTRVTQRILDLIGSLKDADHNLSIARFTAIPRGAEP
jgi:glycosyltransferase involved in cell wall biosynthesis